MTQLTAVKDKVVFPPLSTVGTAGIYTVPRRFKRPSKIKLSGKHKALVASSKEQMGHPSPAMKLESVTKGYSSTRWNIKSWDGHREHQSSGIIH